MKTIKCQSCNSKDKGCSICGGYKEVLIQNSCTCGQKYWTTPGVHTLYEGKRFKSFDGLTIIAHLTKPNECSQCEPKEEWDDEEFYG